MEIPQIVRTYVKAWSSRDLNGYLAAYAPDGTYCSSAVPQPSPVKGLKEHFEGFFEGFPYATCETVGLDSISDHSWVWRFVIRGTHTGSFRGFPATGHKIEAPGCEFIEIHDDRVRNVVGYFDRLTILNQLGLTPGKFLDSRQVGALS
jgi:steroid delta-isomerase-like uncharacterized protein